MKAKDGVHLKQKKSSSFFVLIKKSPLSFIKLINAYKSKVMVKYSL